MFLQKAIISLALSGIATPGVMTSTTLPIQSQQAIKSPKHLEPFNPASLNNHAQGYGNYFAYYKGSAFKSPFSSAPTNGYILELNARDLGELIQLYDWGINNHKNPQGAMICYLTDYLGYDTPNVGFWMLDSSFQQDSSAIQEAAISYAFASNQLPNVDQMVKDASASDQTLDFFFYTQVQSDVLSKVMVENPYTGASITTKWYVLHE